MLELSGPIDVYPADTPTSPTTDLIHDEGRRPDYPFHTIAGKAMYTTLYTCLAPFAVRLLLRPYASKCD